MPPLLRCALATALVLTGCSKDSPASGAPPSGAETPAPPTLAVDGESVATLGLAEGEGPRRLTTWLTGEVRDPARWVHLQAEAPGGRRFAAHNVAIRYPGAEAWIERVPGEGYAVGLYRPVPTAAGGDASGRGPRITGLSEISRVEIFTADAPRPAAAATRRAPVRVQVPQRGAFTLSEAQLASIPHTADPRGREDGWRLADVAKLALGGAAPLEVIVVLEGDVEERFSRADLEDAERLVLLKHNREGDLRVQVFGGAEGPENPGRPARVLKGIRILRVIPAP